MAAVGNLAMEVSNQEKLAKAGAIPLLVQVLGSDSKDAQHGANRALRFLAQNANNKKVLESLGVLSTIKPRCSCWFRKKANA